MYGKFQEHLQKELTDIRYSFLIIYRLPTFFSSLATAVQGQVRIPALPYCKENL